MTMTSILEVLPAQLRAALRGLDWDKIQELRLRSGYPLGIKRVGEREAAHTAAHDPAHDAAGVVRAEDVAAVLAAATRQSAYSAQETLREGYLTLEGGHRVGVCGTLVLRGGEPYSMKDVTSLNIRVAHDIRMDSARLLPYLRENLLIIGVPVGFVNVVQSKELIMETEVPYIVARGRKGGSNIAACICNALLYMIDNKRD